MNIKFAIISFFITIATYANADYKVVSNTDFGQARLVAQIKENCSATFISPGVAITAHHCVDDINSPLTPIYTGRTNKDDFKEELFIEKTYKITGKDIAIVEVSPRVEWPLQFFPKVRSVHGKVMREKQRDLIMWGYPGSLGSKMVELEPITQTYSRTTIRGSKFSYFTDTEGGVSGSSIRFKGEEDTIIGIHTHGRDDHNSIVHNDYGIGDTFSKKEVQDINEIILNNEAKHIEELVTDVIDEQPMECNSHEEPFVHDSCDSESIFTLDQTFFEDVHIYETWNVWESINQTGALEK